MRQRQVIVSLWLLAGWMTFLGWQGTASAKRCNRSLCYEWDARKKRCVFRCKTGKEVCIRSQCYPIKQCKWSRCEQFSTKTGRCESRCSASQLCDKGRCVRSCPNKGCYDAKTLRCLLRCPAGRRCIAGRCS